MNIGYSDYVLLHDINKPIEEWSEWLSVRGDGIYIKIPPDETTAQERAALTDGHPTGNLNEPALKFPCTLAECREFDDRQGVYGSIDAFVMADWVLKKRDEESKGVPEPDGTGCATSSTLKQSKLAILHQASAKWWANADRDDRGTHPAKDEVVAWLYEKLGSMNLAKAGGTIIRPDWAKVGRSPD